MNSTEAAVQEDRVKRYKDLKAQADQIKSVIAAIAENDPEGPCGQGPFTTNTRESREVHSLEIYFSPTRGKSPPVKKFLSGVNISAPKLGEFLRGELRAKLAAVTEAMEKI
jgi:hypothetical protein